MELETKIKEIEEVELENPIVLEGLPGIGFVGKIVVDQIIKQLDATKFAELESDYFPPQVTMKKNGLIDVRNILMNGSDKYGVYKKW